MPRPPIRVSRPNQLGPWRVTLGGKEGEQEHASREEAIAAAKKLAEGDGREIEIDDENPRVEVQDAPTEE